MTDLPSHEKTYATTVDSSMSSLPAWLMDTYGDMNTGIVEDREEYGDTMQYHHLMLSKAAISATARTALHRAPAHEARNAIILGAGNCFDIPLEEIVSEFTTTTLVDVEMGHTEEALSNLPSHLLGKVTLLHCDVTGTIGALGTIMEQSSRDNEYGQFVQQAAARVVRQAITPPAQLLGQEYSFVCSQLLMTQLASIPVISFSALINERYGRPFVMMRGVEAEPLVLALNDFSYRVQGQHVEQLAGLVKPEGTAHLADTAGALHGEYLMPMVTPTYYKAVGVHFDRLTDDTEWTWESSPGHKFMVLAHSLAPKPKVS